MNEKLTKLIKLAQGSRTQNQYALNCGVSSAAITRICNATYSPKPPVLKKLAEHAFNGITYDDLMLAAGYIDKHLPLKNQLPSNCCELGNVFIYPVIGKICAGFDGAAEEYPTGESVIISEDMLRGREQSDFFVLKINGDSMYPKFLDGDKIFILKCDSVDSGDIAAFLYNSDEATIKKIEYKKNENWIDLIPLNPEYKTKRIEGTELEQCRVIGKVEYIVSRKI